MQRLSSRTALFVLTLAFVACNHAVTPPRLPGTGNPGVLNWELVWSDEFDGASGARVDSTKWNYDIGDGCPAICGWGNTEREYYTDASENIALTGDGQLRITARVAPPGPKCYYGDCSYTSAKITTSGKMEAAPGRVEARIKLAAGQGLWPAFWMLGRNIPQVGWPTSGELDVMENHGSNVTSTSSAVHGPGYSGATPFVRSRPLPSGTYADDFHVFRVEWNRSRITFSVDNMPYYTVQRVDVESRGPWVFDQPFYVIVNLAVGGHFDGDPRSNTIFPATMLVDYVRVYLLR